jgi:hypothetical protein
MSANPEQEFENLDRLAKQYKRAKQNGAMPSGAQDGNSHPLNGATEPLPSVPFPDAPEAFGDMPDNIPLDAYADEFNRIHADPETNPVERAISHVHAEPYQTPEWVHNEPTSDSEWPEPVNLFGGVTFPPFPPGCLPPEIEPYVRDQADRAGVDIAQVALNCYAICAATIRAGIGVQMQEDMGDGSRVWTEYPILWAAVVGMFGEKKGVGLDIAMHQFKAIDARTRMREEESWKAHERKIKIHEKQMQQYYTEAAKNPNAPVPELDPAPPHTRYWTDDATLQGIAKTFTDNPRKKIAVIKDELSGWFGSFDAFTNGKSDIDRPAYLSAYESKARPIDRVGGGTWFIDPWGVPIIGGIQPDVFRKVAARLGADGMLQRFQIVLSRPAVQVPRRPADQAAAAQWKKIMENLAAMMPRGNPVRLSKEAARFMDEKVKWISHAVQSGITPSLAGTVNKWEGLFGRLAITSHCISDAARCNMTQEQLDRGEFVPSPEVSLATMQQCWTWMREFLWPHAVQFYEGQQSSNPENEMLIKFADFVLARGITEVQPGYLSGKWSTYRELKTIQQRREFWDSVLNIGLGRSANQGFDRTGNIPRTIIINPRYLDGRFSARAEHARAQAERYRDIMHPAMLDAQERQPGED